MLLVELSPVVELFEELELDEEFMLPLLDELNVWLEMTKIGTTCDIEDAHEPSTSEYPSWQTRQVMLSGPQLWQLSQV